MVTMRSFPVLVAVSLFALTGCELIGGIETRTLEPADAGVTDASDQDVVTDDAPPDIPTKCELPPQGGTSMRVGNLIPSYARLDFCVKSSNDTWDDVEPILAGGGGACQRGLSYRNITTTFGIAGGGSYDVIAVEDKGTGTPPKCDPAKAVASANQIAVDDGDVVDAFVFGDSVSTAVLRGWKESRANASIESVLRFVNALVGSNNLDCGVATTTGDDLPSAIGGAMGFTDVPFASTDSAGSAPMGSIDSNGYLSLQMPDAEITLAVAEAAAQDAILVKQATYRRGFGYSMFAAGRLGDKQFPEELFVCSESEAADGILMRCGGIYTTLTVDSANVQLAGAWGPYDKDRAAVIPDAIANLPSDVVCVHEAWGKPNKDAIAAATKTKFPNQAVFWYNLDSAPDDGTDQQGNTPPPYTEAPCVGNDQAFSDAMDCIRDNCVDPLGEESGIPAANLSKCVTKNCSLPLIPLLTATPESKVCYSCLFTSIAGWESIADVRDKCLTNPNARWAHGGDGAVEVLSKYPIQNAESWLLGATEWRVNIVRAPIKLPNDAIVDVYCTQLTTPGVGMTRPYTGHYGENTLGVTCAVDGDCAAPGACPASATLGCSCATTLSAQLRCTPKCGSATDCPDSSLTCSADKVCRPSSDEAWKAELYLQAQKLVNYVHARSSAIKRKAVIVGSIYSGLAYPDSQLDEVNVNAYNTISAAFPTAWPRDYVPTCTLCNDNPILSPPGSNPAPGGSWQSFVFMTGMPVTAALSDSIFWKDEPTLQVTFPDTGDPIDITLSTHYGFRSVIRVFK